MFTIYLIEILTTICCVLLLGICVAGFFLICYIIDNNDDFEKYKDKLNEAKKYLSKNNDSEKASVKEQIKYYEDVVEYVEHDIKVYKNNIKKFIITIAVLTVLFIVTPNTQTAYRIYGIGSVVEYVRENPKAKGLPDKVIDRLDKWLDNDELTDRDKDTININKNKE